MQYETRFAELRFDGEQGIITGVALRYGSKAKLGGFQEVFERDSCVVADDAIVNLQHDRGRPVARLGHGFEMRSDGDDIIATIKPPDTTHGKDAIALVRASVLRGLSIEFNGVQDRWHGKTRIISKATIVGLGIVDKPAYPDSQIAQRWNEAGKPKIRVPVAYVRAV